MQLGHKAKDANDMFTLLFGGLYGLTRRNRKHFQARKIEFQAGLQNERKTL
jgi:hypothetical protein